MANEPQKWADPLGSGADVNTIPEATPAGTGAASMKSIFPPITQVPLNAGGIAPDRADFNGLFKLLGDNIYYQQQGGVYSYDSTIDYAKGSLVKHNDKIYIAIQANGPATVEKEPGGEPNFWQEVVLSNTGIIATGTTTARSLENRFADVVNVKDFGAVGDGVTDDTIAIQNAADEASEGAIVYMPSGDYKITSTLNVTPVIFKGDGDSTTIHFYPQNTNSDLFVFSTPKNSYISCGLCDLDIKLHNSNARYLVDTTALNYHKVPMQRYINIQIYADPLTGNQNNGFAVLYSWSCMFRLGDARLVDLRNIDAYGTFLHDIDPNTQTLDTFCQFAPTNAIMSAQVKNIRTYNIANGFEIIHNTYYSFDTIDIIKSYQGIFDSPNRIWDGDVKKYSYGETIWNNVIINSVYRCVYLDFKYALSAHGLYLHKASTGFTGVQWIGIQLDSSNSCNLSNTEIANAAYVANDNSIGIKLSKAVSCNFCNVSVYSVGTIFSLGEDSNTCRGLNVSNVSVMGNVDTVVNAYSLRSSAFNNLSYNNATGSIGTVITYGDLPSQSQTRLINFMGNSTVSNADHTSFEATSGASNQKRIRFNFKDGLTLATENDNSTLGENFFITSRVGVKTRKIELRTGTTDGYIVLSAGDSIQAGNTLKPTTDAVYNLGSLSFRWNDIYAANGSIITSDERQKTEITDPNDALMKAWGKVNFKVFKFKDAIEKKGDNARKHVGVIAQEVQKAFESEGLNASDYGLFCYDEWEDQYEKDEEGNEVLVQKAGNAYGIRYTEALALECAYQRWLGAKREARIKALEAKLK